MDESKAVEANEKKERSEWEIKDDLRAVKRAIEIFKDKERLKDVKDLIKAKKGTEEVLDAIADGEDLNKALGLS